ncbi:MAG TPA: hypothetical protein DER02_11290 [Gammaproteobacteria bacterium]|nr:hypothetical protein [Gammaproteobacteria bacterium]
MKPSYLNLASSEALFASLLASLFAPDAYLWFFWSSTSFQALPAKSWFDSVACCQSTSFQSVIYNTRKYGGTAAELQLPLIVV